MATTARPIDASSEGFAGEGAKSPTRSQSVIEFLRHELLGTIGLVLVLIIAVAGLLADVIAPYNPTANDFSAMMEAPSSSICSAPTSSGAISSRAFSTGRERP